MWEALAIFVIVAIVGLFVATFFIKDDNHVLYRVLGKVWKWYLILGLIFTVVYACSQSMGSGSSYEERQYRGRR